ncbi:hypothetical protein BB561_003814 [Smittium simulii]|uniref:V-SNARE coiled-coil homology domain-containing protein n=1 Tax=Smittium simulii TaxID=133385 RepID=A0A2T9YJF3_9FUNG|nr:hypothetical protein BB561_003814 [Smittium simulii]
MFFKSKNRDSTKIKDSMKSIDKEKIALERKKQKHYNKPRPDHPLVHFAFPPEIFQNNWNPQHSFNLGFDDKITSTAFNPLQNVLAIATETGQIMVLGKNGLCSPPFLPNPHQQAPIVYLAFHLGSSLLISIDISNAVCIVNFDNNKLCAYYEAPQTVTCIDITAGSPWLLFGQSSGRVYFIDVEKHIKSDYSISYKGSGANQPITAISINPNGPNNILLGYLNGQIAYYCIEQDRILAEYNFDPKAIPELASNNKDFKPSITSLSWYPDSSKFVATFDNGAVIIFSILNSVINVEKLILIDSKIASEISSADNSEDEPYYLGNLECCLDNSAIFPHFLVTGGSGQWDRTDLVFIDPDSAKIKKISFPVPILSHCSVSCNYSSINASMRCISLTMDDGAVKFFQYDSLDIFSDNFTLTALVSPETLSWNDHHPRIIEFSSLLGFKSTSLKPSNSRIDSDTSDFIRGGCVIYDSSNSPSPKSSILELNSGAPETFDDLSLNATKKSKVNSISLDSFTKKTSIAITYSDSKLISLWDISKSYPQMISLHDINIKSLELLLDLKLSPSRLYFDSLNKILAVGMDSGFVLLYYIGDSPPSWVHIDSNHQDINEESLSDKFEVRKKSTESNQTTTSSKKKNSLRESLNKLRLSISSTKRNSADSHKKFSIVHSTAKSIKSAENSIEIDRDYEKYLKDLASLGLDKPPDGFIDIIPFNKFALVESSIQFVFPLINIKFHKYSITCLSISDDCQLFISDSAGLISCIDISNSKVVGWIVDQCFVRNKEPYCSIFSYPVKNENTLFATMLHCSKLKIIELDEPISILVAVYNDNSVIYYSYLEDVNFSGQISTPNIGKIIYLDTIVPIDYSSFVSENPYSSDSRLVKILSSESGIQENIMILVGTYDNAFFLECVDGAGVVYLFSLPNLALLFKEPFPQVVSEEWVYSRFGFKKSFTYLYYFCAKNGIKPPKIQSSTDSNWWLWNLASTNVSMETRLETNSRDISTKQCQCSLVTETPTAQKDSMEKGDTLVDKDNQNRSNSTKGAGVFAETTQKLKEREDKLNEVSDSTAKMASAASDLMNDIKEYNKAQKNKKWWQF